MIARTRRAKVDRWIASLTPFFDVIAAKQKMLSIGEPGLTVGPTLMHDGPGPCIRKGAVWWINDRNCGFHVDFYSGGIHIEAWTGRDRKTSTSISGKVTESTLKKDLTVCLVAAGLTDLARTEEVRANLFTRTAKK